MKFNFIIAILFSQNLFAATGTYKTILEFC